jgi:hypothetical protein
MAKQLLSIVVRWNFLLEPLHWRADLTNRQRRPHKLAGVLPKDRHATISQRYSFREPT